VGWKPLHLCLHPHHRHLRSHSFGWLLTSLRRKTRKYRLISYIPTQLTLDKITLAKPDPQRGNVVSSRWMINSLITCGGAVPLAVICASLDTNPPDRAFRAYCHVWRLLSLSDSPQPPPFCRCIWRMRDLKSLNTLQGVAIGLCYLPAFTLWMMKGFFDAVPMEPRRIRMAGWRESFAAFCIVLPLMVLPGVGVTVLAFNGAVIFFLPLVMPSDPESCALPQSLIPFTARLHRH